MAAKPQSWDGGFSFRFKWFTCSWSVSSAPSPTPPPDSVNQPFPPHNLPQGPAFVRGRAGPHAGDLLRDVVGVYRELTPVAEVQAGPVRS